MNTRNPSDSEIIAVAYRYVECLLPDYPELMTYHGHAVRDAFLAGFHYRDAEIKRLREALENIYDLDDHYKVYSGLYECQHIAREALRETSETK